MNTRKAIVCGAAAVGLAVAGTVAVLCCTRCAEPVSDQSSTVSAGEKAVPPHRWNDPEYKAMIQQRIDENSNLAAIAGKAHKALRKAKAEGVEGEELSKLQKAYDDALLAMEKQRVATQVIISQRMHADAANGSQFQQKKGQ